MKQTALIVDDETTIRNVMAVVFQRMEFDVHKAGNGKEALEILKKTPISIIYLDLAMPEMGGVELMRAMVKDEKLKVIPIIIDTAQGASSLPSISKEFDGKLRIKAFNRPTPIELVEEAVKELIGK